MAAIDDQTAAIIALTAAVDTAVAQGPGGTNDAQIAANTAEIVTQTGRLTTAFPPPATAAPTGGAPLG